MPFKRTYKSKSNKAPKSRTVKRTYRKRRYPNTVRTAKNINRSGVTVQRGREPFGAKFLSCLQYAEVNPAATNNLGLIALANTYVLNSVYQPRYGGSGGHQPYQYDQISSAYERVFVPSCKVKLTFEFPSDAGLMVGYRVRPNTDTYSPNGDYIEYTMEKQNVNWKVLPYTGSQRASFSFYVKNYAVFGVSHSVYANEIDYSHTTTGNPAAFTCLDVFVVNPGSTQIITCKYTIQLQYYAIFTGPQVFSHS